ncbi:hypothetical protein INT48_005610 [Thamnidium elegans]|uniref:SH3 domain-containing protein n=1 Tax=Thamnidium elegans TaxID=101142 RepID=A0A8H7SHT1_9FUNG|nr:hypothetical protein INT48_005610 [Thamnidium elegans]
MKKPSTPTSFNSPLPTDLAGECKKATKILNSFLDPGQGFDIIIPPSILENSMGLAIFTVLKAGFLFSGRAGSGLVVARLPDGSWSAPSALFTGGIGAGGQIGAELTDFVLVLNTKEAVKTFSHFGNITLGGNISIAAGPIGRNAEASGSATLKHISAVYSYSKTRGLFAGVSLEGSVICTRNDANEKMYGERYTAKQLLNGTVPAPSEADSLYRALNAKFRSFGSMGSMYQRKIEREPVKIYRNTTISAPGTLRIPPVRRNIGYMTPSAPTESPITIQYNKPFQPDSPITPHLNKPFQPDSPMPRHINKPNQFSPVVKNARASMPSLLRDSEKISYYSNESSSSLKTLPSAPLFDGGQRMSFTTDVKKPASAPLFEGQRMSFTTEIKKTVPAPLFDGQRMSFTREINPSSSSETKLTSHQKAKALYAYTSEQEGDLSFQAGDVILVTEKTDNQDAWWTGKLRGQSGSFPSNYVELL